MKVQIDLNLKSAVNNRIGHFAGLYLMHLKDPDIVNKNFSKSQLFFLHLFGKLSLVYLLFVGILIRGIEIITNKELLSKL